MKKAACLILLSFILLLSSTLLIQTSSKPEEAHVYYGYAPLGTTPSPTWVFDEVIDKKTIVKNLTGLTQVEFLDVIGFEDDTHVELWDIVTGQKTNSTVLRKLEKETFMIKMGTYFKVVSDKRVGVYLWGGANYYGLGATTFYPALDGGFVGRKFVFLSSTTNDLYNVYRRGVQLLLMGLEKVDFTLRDSTGDVVTSGSLDQHASKEIFLVCRVGHGDPVRGGGSSILFELESSGNVLGFCTASGSMSAVPSVTGGFVGKYFAIPEYINIDETGGTVALIIVPLGPGKVTIYDKDRNQVAEKTFAESDIDKDIYWFYNLGKVRTVGFIRSESDITVLIGVTRGYEEEYYLGDNISFMAAKAGQNIKFFAPTSAIIFSPEDATITVDGVRHSVSRDGFLVLEQGVHSVVSSAAVIIQILAASTGFNDWGSYLVEPLDAYKELEVPPNFLSKGFDIIYVEIAIAAAVVAASSFLIIKKRKR